MNAANIIIGHTYYSGSTYNPEISTVLAVDVAFADLPAAEQAHFRTLERTGSGRVDVTFVRFVSHRPHDLGFAPGASGYLWQDVFAATHHASHDAMISARVAADAARGPMRGLPGAFLPGDR